MRNKKNMKMGEKIIISTFFNFVAPYSPGMLTILFVIMAQTKYFAHAQFIFILLADSPSEITMMLFEQSNANNKKKKMLVEHSKYLYWKTLHCNSL